MRLSRAGREWNFYQHCFCLCFGFSQITMTLPFLLIILHFSHMGFTLGLTFIRNSSLFPRPEAGRGLA